MAYSVTLNATGVTKIATAGQGAGLGGWYLVITANTNSNGTAWNGSLVLKQDQNAPGSVTQPMATGSLTTVAYYDSNGAAVSAGTALTATTTVTVADTRFDLYLAHTLTTAGTTVTVTRMEATLLAAETVPGTAYFGSFIGPVTGAVTGAASTNTTQGNALRSYLADGMLAIGTITVSGGDATKFKTTTTAIYTISGAAYSKAATDTLAFSTAGTINTAGAAGTAHWGAWLVQIDSAGTITTKAVGGGTTDQDYATEALAIAALPAVTAANCQLGYITVQGLASTAWAATTSNLTVGGGAGNCTARSFYNLPAAKTLPAAI